jgi:hypothetical protein
MALHTLRRCSSKNALQVAPLARDLRMAAAERKTSAAVIDFDIRADTSLSRSGIRHQQRRAADRQKPGNNCPDKEPTPCPAGQLSHYCHSAPPNRLRHIEYWDYSPNFIDAHITK